MLHICIFPLGKFRSLDTTWIYFELYRSVDIFLIPEKLIRYRFDRKNWFRPGTIFNAGGARYYGSAAICVRSGRNYWPTYASTGQDRANDHPEYTFRPMVMRLKASCLYEYVIDDEARKYSVRRMLSRCWVKSGNTLTVKCKSLILRNKKHSCRSDDRFENCWIPRSLFYFVINNFFYIPTVLLFYMNSYDPN